jgi:outer membrane protein TolC
LALAKKLKFEIQLESNTKKLRLEMNSLRSELLNLAKQIEVSRQLVATSKNRFEKSQIEFDANRKTSTDYFASQLGLSVAKLSLIKSVFTYLQVKEKYDFHLKYPK